MHSRPMQSVATTAHTRRKGRREGGGRGVRCFLVYSKTSSLRNRCDPNRYNSDVLTGKIMHLRGSTFIPVKDVLHESDWKDYGYVGFDYSNVSAHLGSISIFSTYYIHTQ